MNSRDSSDFFKQLSELAKKLSAENSLSSIHNALRELYQVIQKCTVKVDNSSILSLDQQDIFFPFIQRLASILSDNVFPADSMLLSSTCLAVLIADLFSSEFASTFLISLYCFIGDAASDDRRDVSVCEKSTSDLQHFRKMASDCIEQSESLTSLMENFTHEENTPTNIQIPTFHQIALLHGILSCQKSNLFPFRSKHLKHKPFLITMFNSIHFSCITPCSSQFHAFSVLVNWLRTCEKLLRSLFSGEESKGEVFFSSKTQIVSKILSLLASNWESPIKGVSGFVKEAYRILIALSAAENEFLRTSNFDLVDFLLEQTMKLSWKIKGKYLVLSVALQFIDYRKFFDSNPEVPSEVIFNLKANYASSVISEVYKSIVSSMKKYNSIDAFHSEWCRWWRKPIIESLASNDKLLIQNITNLVLPWTLKTIPKSYELILDDFGDENIAPKLMLLRIAKESGICLLQEKEIKLILKYLHHHNVQLRMEILSILCCSPKKSEPIPLEELELLKDFIAINLNIDSTPFQQQFLSQLRILLVRIRDSLVQEYRLKAKNVDVQLSPSQLAFIDWLARMAVNNCFPGACFQRRRISLHILNIIFDVFIVSPLGTKRKEKPSKFVEQVIQVAQTKGFWNFFQDDLLLNILPCITDFTDEIRTLTSNLIMEFSAWPMVSNESCILNAESVLKYAYTLCNHPDYRSNDGGALLVCLIYRKTYIKVTTSEFESSAAMTFLTDVAQIITNQLDDIQRSLVNSNPVHGYLLALQYCMNCSKDVFKTSFQVQKERTLSFIQTIIDLCNDIIKYMLNVMKGDNEKSNCPSFSDIGQALEKLVISKETGALQTSIDNNDFKEEQKFNDAYSPEVELLLACCWHSIKNSCFLLCELAFCVCDLNMDSELKKQLLQVIATKLSSILITCRHRGVVDACSLALNKFCLMLLKDDVLHEEICKFLLNLVFDSLSDATATSVTRRSAGLPSLVQAVVSSEQNNIKRKLLSFAVEKLLVCIQQPLTPSKPISDKTDLPQAHAYHIFKALVMDSSLSQAILSHLDTIIPACISGFSSTLWPIRNGALQLFGVLLPRICGQKKVREDDSEHNLVSASELFARCPSLKAYLLQQLKKCVMFHQNKKLCSELVPVLSIIVKLSPPQRDIEDYVSEFKTLLLELLNVPIWKVRDLVSSALAVMMTPKDSLDIIEELKMGLQKQSFNCNKYHGNLLLIQKVLKKNNVFQEAHCIVMSLVELYNILTEKKCPLLLGIVLDIILTTIANPENSYPVDLYESLHIFGTEHSFDIGQSYHNSRLFLLMLKVAANCDIPALIKQHAMKDDATIMIECIQFLSCKLHSGRLEKNFYEENNLKNWKEIYIAVIDCMDMKNHPSVIQEALKFMIDLCNDWRAGYYILDLNTSEFVKDLLQHNLEMKSGLSAGALSLTKFSLCIKSDLQRQTVSGYLDKWNILFNTYCQPRSSDILRMQAACSVACLGPALMEYLTEKVKMCQNSQSLLIGLCEGSLLLLQDEDEEIRSKACEFPSNIPHKYEINFLQFNIGIQVIFQCMFKLLHGNSNFLLYLWNRLQNYPSAAKVLHGLRSIDYQMKMNLFEQEYVNVYAEPVQILLEYKNLLKRTLRELHYTNYSLWCERVEMFISDLKIEITDLYSILSRDVQKEINKGFACPHQGFLALKKLHCQLEVVLDQKEFFPSDSTLYCSLCETSSEWETIEKHFTVITCWFLHQL